MKFIKTKLYENKNYEIALMTWGPKIKSPIHNHSQNGCIYKIINGVLIEECFDTSSLNLINIGTLIPNDIGYIDNSIAYHRIINDELQFAHSIHVYSPPNFDAQCF